MDGLPLQPLALLENDQHRLMRICLELATVEEENGFDVCIFLTFLLPWCKIDIMEDLNNSLSMPMFNALHALDGTSKFYTVSAS